MPSVISTSLATPFATAPAHRVYTRARWSDAWTLQQHLYCDRCTFSAAPEFPTATLSWRYGVGMPAGTTAVATWPRKTITGQYTKIEIDQPNGSIVYWFGRILETPEQRDGALNLSGARVLTGDQALNAVGLEYELAREPITKSVVRLSTGGEVTIGRAIAFNKGSDDTLDATAKGDNASSVAGGSKGTNIFTDDMATVDPWTSEDILEYLLAYFPPLDNAGMPAITWEFDPSGTTHLLATAPTCSAEGRSIKEICDELMNAGRLCGWKVVVDPTTEVATIVPFTLTDTAIVLPDGTTYGANANTKSFDFDQSYDIEECRFITTIANQFDQVLTRGARKGSVFNASKLDSTIDKDWSTADQNRYNTATSVIDPSLLPYDARRVRDGNYRAAEDLQRVYSWYRIPASWGGTAGNGEGGGGGQQVFPTPDPATGLPNTTYTDPFWLPGLRIERYLPLKTGRDYTGTKIAAGTVTDSTPAGSRAEFLAPMVFLKIDDVAGGTGHATRYQYVERLGATSHVDSGFDFSCAVRVLDNAPGIALKVTGGPQHKIALADFVACHFSDDIIAELDWQNNLLAVVYVLADARVEERYPDDASVGAVDHVRRLILDVPDAHLDYVVPGTVVGLIDGVLQKSTSGGYLADRDDRARLKNLARLAYEWFHVERKALSLSYQQILKLVDVGDLITQIGSGATIENIRTVVTRVTYDLVDGLTSIQTEFAEPSSEFFDRHKPQAQRPQSSAGATSVSGKRAGGANLKSAN